MQMLGTSHRGVRPEEPEGNEGAMKPNFVAIVLVTALAASAAMAPAWFAAPDEITTGAIGSRTAPGKTARPGLSEASDGQGPALARLSDNSPPGLPDEDTASAELRAGLEALASRDMAGALAIRDRLTGAPLDRHILTWAMALSGASGMPASEILKAETELVGWPGLSALKANAERALFREAPSPHAVLEFFGGREPQTVAGAILKARALLASGETNGAVDLIGRTWRSARMGAAETSVFTGEFASRLTKVDHRRRMQMLLYGDHIAEAEAPAQLGEAQSLYKAWAAVIRTPGSAGAAIRAVDSAWKDDPATLYIRIRMLRATDRATEAAALLAEMPQDKDALVDPDEWWVEQRIVSRDLLEAGDARGAYAIAARHRAASPEDIADAEFHAGWYALSGLGDGATASRHFAAILNVAEGPLSRSRAHYWLGRAAEKGGDGDAAAHFSSAAAFPATFYGQLAAARLDRPALSAARIMPKSADRVRFARREAVQAIRTLEASGFERRAEILYRALAADLERPEELALLSAMAQGRGDHALALQVGKIAWNRGLDVAALAFPLGALPETADIDGSGKALAYSIARQESAFNTAAVSPANARGLLQLMPATAQSVAARYGLPYSQERLTSDAGYNATLGAHFLGEQISNFNGSYILTFIAYNAGPRRVTQWINRFGDPRGKNIDEVVDWIEKIPFVETRSYVQRVMENYQVYKMRLGQPADIEADLRFGRR